MKTLILTIFCMALAGPLHGEDAEFQRKLNFVARKVEVDGYKISPKGVTATVTVSKPVRRAVPGAPKEVAFTWVFEKKIDAVVSGIPKEELKLGNYGGLSIAAWSGKAWQIGSIKYPTLQGVLRVLPYFTASEAEAAAFYRANGFTAQSRGVVKESIR